MPQTRAVLPVRLLDEASHPPNRADGTCLPANRIAITSPSTPEACGFTGHTPGGARYTTSEERIENRPTEQRVSLLCFHLASLSQRGADIAASCLVTLVVEPFSFPSCFFHAAVSCFPSPFSPRLESCLLSFLQRHVDHFISGGPCIPTKSIA